MADNRMDNQQVPSLNGIIAESLRKHWNLLALTDMGGVTYRYRDLAEWIEKLHILYREAGLKPGDKVAICGKNSSNWAVTFVSCLTAGLVAVPILHEFKPDMIHHLVNHSDAKILFVDAAIWENLDEATMAKLEGVLFISEYGMPLSRNSKLTYARNNINELFGKIHPYSFEPKDIDYYKDQADELAVINYTSGSTGMSKGVMLPYRSIWSNIDFCLNGVPFLKPGDGMVNMLPLAHLYGMVIEMLHPLCRGCHCYFLTRLPSPKVILNAFAEVKPKLVITVPLILEKIVRNKVFPLLEKPMMKLLLKVPFVDDKILAKVKAGLEEAFGGRLEEVIIGGAAMNGDVEQFLKRINFPFTIGYGMTECGPLITYAPHSETKFHSVGKVVTGMEARVDSSDPENVPGNLWVKGRNVMLGYYKNDQATQEVMPYADGWMNTGDMCTVDKDGYVTISGRSKSMILGPSGQNIYPEEIELKLNSLPYVAESLVIDDHGSLVALIHPDLDNARKDGLDREAIEKTMEQNLLTLNSELPGYSKVKRFKIFEEEFEKTPKRSIKRFLYQP